MAEIRLICPGCTAEYRVPDSALPSGGREVECSACGHVWHATAQPEPGDLPPQPPAEEPADLSRLSRRLPDNVLDILRDEVEHERRARAAEGGTTDPIPDPDPEPAPRPARDPEWPATTITRHIDPKAAEPAPPEPKPAQSAPRTLVPARPVPILAAAVIPADAKPAARHIASPDRQPPRAKPVRGYGLGFGLAVILAAGLVALYLLAPALADQGALGAALSSLRGTLDGARLWLQEGLAGLTR